MDKYLTKISSAQWRKKFLKRFDEIKGLDAALIHANSEKLPTTMPYNHITSEALAITQSYSRNELAWARSHYNNAHLIAFWRWYNILTNAWQDKHAIDKHFPVFYVNNTKSGYSLSSASIASVASNTDDLINKEDYTFLNECFSDLPKYPYMLELFKNIIAIHHIVKNGFNALYDIFINEQKSDKGATWDYYRIHRILDTFLYVRSDGYISGAAFSKIFFNSNMLYLMVFLYHNKTHNKHPTIDETKLFLNRQRIYLSKMAIKNSLAENEILNYCSNMLFYDTRDSVVKIEFSEDLLAYFQKNKVDAYHFKKLNGCPFAKTRGTETTALIEVFVYFDNIMIEFLKKTDFMKNVFKKNIA